MTNNRLISSTSLLLIVFWAAFFSHRTLIEMKRSALAATQRPFVLNGLRLSFARNVVPALTQTGTSGRYLVLLSSDTCLYSQAEVGSWSSLLDAVPFQKEDVVVFVSLNGDKIPRSLIPIVEKRDVRHEVLNVTDVVGFIEHTGLASTPRLLALDSQLNVRLVPPRGTQASIDSLNEFFSGTTH
jgi:hypothetical protein